MRKESIHAWAVERGKKRNWEGEIRSFEIGVFKDIEYQIRQVLHLNNEDFTIFHRINILQFPGLPIYTKHTLVSSSYIVTVLLMMLYEMPRSFKDLYDQSILIHRTVRRHHSLC